LNLTFFPGLVQSSPSPVPPPSSHATTEISRLGIHLLLCLSGSQKTRVYELKRQNNLVISCHLGPALRPSIFCILSLGPKFSFCCPLACSCLPTVSSSVLLYSTVLLCSKACLLDCLHTPRLQTKPTLSTKVDKRRIPLPLPWVELGWPDQFLLTIVPYRIVALRHHPA
jgi:hypothetical protein